MVIKLTDTAKKDLRDFLLYSKAYREENKHFYINSLVEYIKNLNQFPDLGKTLFKIKKIEIKQLVYKKHKILYYYDFNQIYIITIIHNSRDMSKVLKSIKKDLNNLFSK